MSKQNRIDARKKATDRENAKQILQKAEELGLTYHADELPPDELEDSQYKKTLYNSLMSMIPYTQAWYEASAAEEELDNLSKIRIERAKTDDLVAMTKMGRHEEALTKMMAETNHDYFYFNKLRQKMESEGKIKVEIPNLNPFEDLEKGKNRNRIKKAQRMQFALIDDSMMKELAAYNKTVENVGKPKKDAPCSWKGKSKEGALLGCSNLRMRHPRNKIKDTDGTETAEILMYCPYHISSCISDLHSADAPVKIKQPNGLGLCMECFITASSNAKPPKFTRESSPGVYPLSIVTKANASSAVEEGGVSDSTVPGNESTQETLDENSICRWKPPHGNKEMFGYRCCNKVIKDGNNGKFSPYCGFHVKSCVRVHLQGSSAIVAVKNCYGLCTSHYIAEHGSPPPELPFPLPGMDNPRALKQENLRKARHWAAPSDNPPEDVDAQPYEPVEPPTEFIPKLLERARMLKYKRKRKKQGPAAAIVIQKAFRRYQVRNVKSLFVIPGLESLRQYAACRIQSIARRRIYSKKAGQYRRQMILASVLIQRVYRGHSCRVKLLIQWAARRIQKFMKKLHFFRLKDAVIMIMQLRSYFKRRFNNAVTIQRVFRGFNDRYGLWKDRMWTFLQNRAKRIIRRAVYRYIIRMRKRKAIKIPPSEEEVLAVCAKKLSRLLHVLWKERLARREEEAKVLASVVPIQRIVRGFLGRVGAKKVRFLRSALRQWCTPKYATEFMQKYLETRVFQFVPPAVVVEEAPRHVYVREFLDAEHRSRSGVPKKIFLKALESFYKSKGLPLLPTESSEIVRVFTNPGIGDINMSRLESYIGMSKKPCRKHGRMICGTCSFFRECTISSCQCTKFVLNGRADAVCKVCMHPPTLHRLCPQQISSLQSRNSRKESFLAIMNCPRDPDMSKPSAVEGISVTEAIITPVNSHAIRYIEERKERKELQTRSLEKAMSMDLSKQLAVCQVCGDQVQYLDSYWAQHAVSMVHPDDGYVLNALASFCPVAPSYDLSPADFWKFAAKNPNKNLRDYNEKFEHNMPLPVIRDKTLVYTLEGPKVYFNILLQIIKMEGLLNYDYPDFLRMVMDHIQIFERHWRKMVADLRVGKLDKNLLVSPDTREAYEAIAIPRPRLATQLDKTFRKLGFHKKVLGKDIITRKYAELKQKPSTKREPGRFSLPAIAIQEQLRLSTASILSMTKKISFDSSVPTDDFKNITNMSPARSPSRWGSKLLEGSSSPPKSASMKAQRQALVGMGNAMKTGALAELREKEKEELIRAPSSTSKDSAKRRGSDTNLLRPFTSEQVQAIMYDNETAPRAHYFSDSLVRNSDAGVYLCPFPACGKSFRSKDATYEHLKTHEQRVRFFSSTPLPDSHLNAYWPKGSPWLEAPVYTERKLPPGSLSCPHPGCLHVFSSQSRLNFHIQSTHKSCGPSSVLNGYFNMEGVGHRVPPGHPPAEAMTKWCPHHMMPFRQCSVCMDIEAAGGCPKPPLQYFDAVTIDFDVKNGLESGKKGKSARIDKNERFLGLWIKGEGSYEHKGLPVGMLIDRNKNGWIAVRLLAGYQEAVNLKLRLGPHFEKHHELVYKSLNPSDVTWIPMADVSRTFQLYHMVVNDFTHKLNTREIPRLNTFFIRED